MPESIIKSFKRWRRKRVFGEGYHWEDLDGPLPASTKGCKTCFGWTSFLQLQQSAQENKCVCCRIVHKGLVSSCPTYSLSTAKVRVNRKLEPHDFPHKIGVNLNVHGGYEDYEFYRLPGDTAPSFWSHMQARTNISGNTQSPAAIEWMKKCLRDCMAKHDSCQRHSDHQESQLPTRIIDIRGVQEGANQNDVRLVEGNRKTGRYACLSHCWGKSQIIKTTRDTLEPHKTSIAWNLLSKTFQDAIIVASKLEIPYIWIDSLCIVQDDADDWKRESQKMYEVYANCELTIAATKSADGLGGCFATSQDAYTGHLVTDEHDGASFRLYCRKKIAHELYRRNMRVHAPLPLLTRGWVLQERLLAPRVLHFGSEEMFWECSTTASCECGTAQEEEKSRKAEHYNALAAHVPPSLNSRNQVAETAAQYWRDLVVNYTRMKLTYESDRLLAMQGIQTLFAQRRGDRYLAGLWSGSLVRDMLWHVYWTEPTLKTERGLFPSWSWASVNSNIEYQEASKRAGGAKVTVLKHDQKSIVMMGYLAPVRMRYVPNGIPTPNASTPSYPGDDRREITMKYMVTCMDPALEGNSFSFDPDYILEHADQEEGRRVTDREELTCLNLFESSDGRQYSLVLRCLDSKDGTFERLGLAETETGNLYTFMKDLSRVVLV